MIQRFGFGWRESREMLGPVALFPCALCSVGHWFHLVRTQASLTWFNLVVPGTTGVTHQLVCEGCAQEIAYSADEAARAEALIPTALQYLNEEIGENAYQDALKRAGLHDVESYQAAEEDWTCVGCGEVSPLTIPECWNCQGERPVPGPDFDPDQIHTPDLDRIMRDDDALSQQWVDYRLRMDAEKRKAKGR